MKFYAVRDNVQYTLTKMDEVEHYKQLGFTIIDAEPKVIEPLKVEKPKVVEPTKVETTKVEEVKEPAPKPKKVKPKE